MDSDLIELVDRNKRLAWTLAGEGSFNKEGQIYPLRQIISSLVWRGELEEARNLQRWLVDKILPRLDKDQQSWALGKFSKTWFKTGKDLPDELKLICIKKAIILMGRAIKEGNDIQQFSIRNRSWQLIGYLTYLEHLCRIIDKNDPNREKDRFRTTPCNSKVKKLIGLAIKLSDENIKDNQKIVCQAPDDKNKLSLIRAYIKKGILLRKAGTDFRVMGELTAEKKAIDEFLKANGIVGELLFSGPHDDDRDQIEKQNAIIFYNLGTAYSRLGNSKAAQSCIRMAQDTFSVKYGNEKAIENYIDLALIEQNIDPLSALMRIEYLEALCAVMPEKSLIERLRGISKTRNRLREDVLGNANENQFLETRRIKKILDYLEESIRREQPIGLVANLRMLAKFLKKIENPQNNINLHRRFKEDIKIWEENEKELLETIFSLLYKVAIFLNQDYLSGKFLTGKQILEMTPVSSGENSEHILTCLDLASKIAEKYTPALLHKILLDKYYLTTKTNEEKKEILLQAVAVASSGILDYTAITIFNEALKVLSGSEQLEVAKSILKLFKDSLERLPFSKKKFDIIKEFMGINEKVKKIVLENESNPEWIFLTAEIEETRSLLDLCLIPDDFSDIKPDYVNMLQNVIENKDSEDLKESLLKKVVIRQVPSLLNYDKQHIKDNGNKKRNSEILGGGDVLSEIHEIQKVLNEAFPEKRVGLVRYFISSREVIPIIITAENVKALKRRELPFEPEKLIKQCWTDLSNPNKNIPTSLRLASVLVEDLPIKEWEIDTLYIVPSASLANLPFHALYTSDGSHLIYQCEVAYSLSARLLVHLLKKPLRKNVNTLLLGWQNSVKAQEHLNGLISNLGSKFPSAYPANPKSGVETLIKKNEYAVIYAFGHGYAIGHLESYLELGDSQKISARDFLNFGSKAGFVFLNSCELAHSEVISGDFYGMAFGILGGANSSCLLAARPVDRDAASLFGQTLLQKISNGSMLSTALREAVKSDSNPHPSFWAPYFLYGDIRNPYI